ncbi:hypothetical protein [Nocardia tengchongensis]|uniref:hypothetical protein n=1 Tax=Nocardia tengchongensis TaxID=2055889 RepID=UPI0036062476
MNLLFLLARPECWVLVYVVMSLPVAAAAFAVMLAVVVSLFAKPDRAWHARLVLGDVLGFLLRWGRRR